MTPLCCQCLDVWMFLALVCCQQFSLYLWSLAEKNKVHYKLVTWLPTSTYLQIGHKPLETSKHFQINSKVMKTCNTWVKTCSHTTFWMASGKNLESLGRILKWVGRNKNKISISHLIISNPRGGSINFWAMLKGTVT